jgi:hypothetical protein
MKTAVYLTLFVVAICSTAQAEIVITGGTHTVLPNANQTIDIYVTGNGEEASAASLIFQIGDGTAAWPAITDIDLTGPGTLFADNHDEFSPSLFSKNDGRTWLAEAAMEDSTPVVVNGTVLLARLTIDASTAIAGQEIPLLLTNIFMDEDENGPLYGSCSLISNEGFASHPIGTATDGAINVVPEPSAFALLGVGVLGRFAFRNRRRMIAA